MAAPMFLHPQCLLSSIQASIFNLLVVERSNSEAMLEAPKLLVLMLGSTQETQLSEVFIHMNHCADVFMPFLFSQFCW